MSRHFSNETEHDFEDSNSPSYFTGEVIKFASCLYSSLSSYTHILRAEGRLAKGECDSTSSVDHQVKPAILSGECEALLVFDGFDSKSNNTSTSLGHHTASHHSRSSVSPREEAGRENWVRVRSGQGRKGIGWEGEKLVLLLLLFLLLVMVVVCVVRGL